MYEWMGYTYNTPGHTINRQRYHQTEMSKCRTQFQWFPKAIPQTTDAMTKCWTLLIYLIEQFQLWQHVVVIGGGTAGLFFIYKACHLFFSSPSVRVWVSNHEYMIFFACVLMRVCFHQRTNKKERRHTQSGSVTLYTSQSRILAHTHTLTLNP